MSISGHLKRQKVDWRLPQAWRWEQRVTANGHKKSFCGDGNVLILDYNDISLKKIAKKSLAGHSDMCQ